MLAQAHNMRAIGYDLCVWEEAANETPVGTTQIDARHPHSPPSFELAQKGEEILDGFNGHDIEDAVFCEIAEGGGETLLFVEGVFIDTEYTRAV